MFTQGINCGIYIYSQCHPLTVVCKNMSYLLEDTVYTNLLPWDTVKTGDDLVFSIAGPQTSSSWLDHFGAVAKDTVYLVTDENGDTHDVVFPKTGAYGFVRLDETEFMVTDKGDQVLTKFALAGPRR